MTDSYNLLEAAQTLARKNNDHAAVHRADRKRRRIRRKLTLKSTRPKKTLAARGWRVAERAARPVRAVGFFMPEAPAPAKNAREIRASG